MQTVPRLFLGHPDRFDGLAVLKPEQVAAGAVLRFEAALDFRPSDHMGPRQLLAQIQGKGGNGAEIGVPVAIQRPVKLPGPVGGLVWRKEVV